MGLQTIFFASSIIILTLSSFTKIGRLSIISLSVLSSLYSFSKMDISVSHCSLSGFLSFDSIYIHQKGQLSIISLSVPSSISSFSKTDVSVSSHSVPSSLSSFSKMDVSVSPLSVPSSISLFSKTDVSVLSHFVLQNERLSIPSLSVLSSPSSFTKTDVSVVPFSQFLPLYLRSPKRTSKYHLSRSSFLSISHHKNFFYQNEPRLSSTSPTFSSSSDVLFVEIKT